MAAKLGPTNLRCQVGRADGTGLPSSAADVAMMRHVLAHNGGREQAIVDHLGTLVRPGGFVYVVDRPCSSGSMPPAVTA